MLHDEKEFLLRQFRKVIKLGGPGVCSAGKFWTLDLLKSPETCIFCLQSFQRGQPSLIETSSLSYLSNLLINFYFVDTKLFILANRLLLAINRQNHCTYGAYDHTTVNAPVLFRSPKLSIVGSCQYLDGWPPGNSWCCRLLHSFFYLLFLFYLFTLFI